MREVRAQETQGGLTTVIAVDEKGRAEVVVQMGDKSAPLVESGVKAKEMATRRARPS